jgi:serine/threonine-protein kinase RsbW
MTMTTQAMTVTAPNAEETVTGQDDRPPLTGGSGAAAARVFPGRAAQATHVRRWARTAACRPGGPDPDEVDLVVTELFVNAVLHTRSGDPGGTVTVVVTADGVIHVHDQGVAGACPGLAAEPSGGERRECGRGLAIVAALGAGPVHLPAAWCPAARPGDPALAAGGCCTCCRPAVGAPAPPVPAQQQPRPAATPEGSALP